MTKRRNPALVLTDKILGKFNTGTLLSLKSFFMGKWYPILVAAIVFLGHTFGIEVYLLPVNMLLFALAMLVCDTVRPLIVVLCTFLYQVPLMNTPGGPVWSDHYATGVRPAFMLFSVVVILLTLVYTVIKHCVFTELSFRRTPLIISMAILGVAFIMGGAFSATWMPADILWGVLQAVLFPVLFLLFYRGLRNEKDLSELGLYLAYVASVIGVLLALEMLDLYIFGNDFYGSVFNADGSVIKERIHLGWATWNPVGVAIAVNIPMIFYGVIKGKAPWAYFISACVTYVASLLTFSRNAMIFATLAFGASVLISCFFGEKRRKLVLRIIVGLGALGIIGIAVIVFDKIMVFARDIFDRGLSDNGRFNVWKTAVDNFKSAPIFGSGYYHFNSPELYNFSPAIPLMAHQTFLQLLSSMGVFGLVAYLVYRFDTAMIFFRRPTLLKTMLGASMLVLLLESLLDNFIFTIFPLFFYSIALAVAALISESQREKTVVNESSLETEKE